MSINILKNRISCATLIQDIGNKIKRNSDSHSQSLPQYVINAALIYMHQFIDIIKDENINKIYLAATCINISCKNLEKTLPLNVIADIVLSLAEGQISKKDEKKNKIIIEISKLENMVLSVIGFSLNVIHGETISENIRKSYKLESEFISMCNFVCTEILHFTDLICRISMTGVMSVAIYIVLKWEYVDLKPLNSKYWFNIIDPTLTVNKIKAWSEEFLEIYHQIPTKLKVLHFKTMKSTPTTSADSTSVNVNEKSLKRPSQSHQYSDTKMMRRTVDENKHTKERHNASMSPDHFTHSQKSKQNITNDTKTDQRNNLPTNIKSSYSNALYRRSDSNERTPDIYNNF